MKTSHFSIVTLSIALAASQLAPHTASAQTAQTAATTTSESAPSKTVLALQIPNNLTEIVKLNKAGVGDPVILAFIQNSREQYTLSAQDIIKLRDEGVSAQVTTALMQRGAEIRQAVQEAYKQGQTQAATVAAAPTYQTTPAPTYAPAPAPVTYVVQSEPVNPVSVTYIGYPSYSYPSYYYPRYASYCGPRYYYTPGISFGIGFGGHRHGGIRAGVRFGH